MAEEESRPGGSRVRAEPDLARLSRHHFLGIWVNALTLAELTSVVGSAIRARVRTVVANHNLNSLYLFHHDPRMRALYARAGVVHIDGMPLVWLGRLLGHPLRPAHRVTYVDWVRPLLAEAARSGWRVFYLGSKPGVAERAAAILRAELPGLEIACADGYFDVGRDSAGNLDRLAAIRRYRPDLLMVGMGMPRQEHWIEENLEELATSAILPAGACFDYVAGAVPSPPRWMGRVGLEWLHRLMSDPRRLWRRYLVDPWYVLGLLGRELRQRWRR